MAASAPQPQLKPTNLMDLPLELRLKIYEYTVVQRSPICINRSWQHSSLLKLGSGFCDLDAVTKLFYKTHAFVYYLTGLNHSEHNIRPLINRLAELRADERDYVQKVTIVCFWACKDVTIEMIQQSVEKALSEEEVEESLRSWMGKLKFAHTDEVWKHM